jgi:hypothetical protein
MSDDAVEGWDWAFRAAGVKMPGLATPLDLLKWTGWQIDPLPQTFGELGKQIKEGAKEAAGFYKDAARKMHDEFNVPLPLGQIPKALGIPKHWLLPLMLKGSTMQDTTEKLD